MEIQSIREWANQNQGFLAIILFLIATIIGWIFGIFKWIFKKKSKVNPTNISVKKKFVQKGGKNSNNIQGENITVKKNDR